MYSRVAFRGTVQRARGVLQIRCGRRRRKTDASAMTVIDAVQRPLTIACARGTLGNGQARSLGKDKCEEVHCRNLAGQPEPV